MTEAHKGFNVRVPFVEHLGFELRVFEGGRSEILFTPRPEHLNSFSVAHGGVLMTLLDVTLACAARSVLPDSGVVTIEMKTSFMRPAVGTLTARGELMQRTATMAFTQGSVFDADGQLCAHATGTFKYAKALPVGARSTHALQISTD